MNFISTRDKNRVVTFTEALFQGLSPDGGLYIPEGKINLSSLFSSFSEDTSFLEIASKMTYALLNDTFTEEQAHIVAKNAFTFNPAIVDLNSSISILELFHGKSCAFKDYGASFLAASMEALLDKNKGQAVILTATSGDTGSAVAQAFVNKKNVDVVILYPSGRVSPLQEKQLTSIGNNI
ncbi:MAG: hypothetical protein GY756_15380 [bacterium]|nr:hypothetical protein [bacterium]